MPNPETSLLLTILLLPSTTYSHHFYKQCTYSHASDLSIWYFYFIVGKCPETVKLIGAGPNDKPTFHREQDKSQSLATTHRLEIPRLTTSANYSPFTVIVDLLLPELPQAGKPLSLVQVSCSSYPLISVDNAGAVYCGHNKTPFRSPNPLFKLKTNKWYRVAAAVIDADNSTKGTATIFLDGKVVMSQSIPYYEDAFSSKSTIHFFGVRSSYHYF